MSTWLVFGLSEGGACLEGGCEAAGAVMLYGFVGNPGAVPMALMALVIRLPSLSVVSRRAFRRVLPIRAAGGFGAFLFAPDRLHGLLGRDDAGGGRLLVV